MSKFSVFNFFEKRILHKLRHNHSSFTFVKQNLTTNTTSLLKLPIEVLPSKEFLKEVKGKNQLDHLTCILGELMFLYEISTEVPTKLSSEQWNILIQATTVVEREWFLRSIYFSEIGTKKMLKNNSATKEFQLRAYQSKNKQFEEGSMVYGKSFYSLFGEGFEQQEMRKKIDNFYGNRHLQGLILDEPLPKFVVDCRYLSKTGARIIFAATSQIQQVEAANWSNKLPFEMIIANFFANDTISRAIKRHWFFLFGPNFEEATNEELFEAMEFLVDEDEEPCSIGSSEDINFHSDFEPHPFRPSVTTWGIEHACGGTTPKDQMAYISPRATRLLDGPLNRFKVFILPACRDIDHVNTCTQSLACSVEDGITAYRLPLDKYLRGFSDTARLSPVVVTNVIREVYYEQMSWKEALEKFVPTFLQYEDPLHSLDDRRSYRLVKHERTWRVNLLRSVSKQLKITGPFMEAGNKFDTPMPRVRRYTREERNRRKSEAKQL